MQVMNSAEFEQKEVLIGQQGTTESFGVSNDASLMSMLSTGLYAYPLRTMIQEIIFNAWDAHRMGNCQQTTPIDIYLNDTTGLIVRDYGPGIHPDQMVPIYCIYGNSTKRDDKGSTGGFGLGSKSPFAYTESFTVTSFHNNKQNMYLISRASDDNDGKPGLTKIIDNIDTEETGLLVTVPLANENDMHKAYEHIKDLLFLSGIWANIHFKDEDPEEIVSDKLESGQWEFDSGPHDHGIWAVYGGVRYQIPNRDEYTQELEFLTKLRRAMDSGLFIGFAPDTLTPLPNREGLNMSVRTVETIKAQLESMVDFYAAAIKPALRKALECGIRDVANTGIQPHFLAYRWREVGQGMNLSGLVKSTTTYYRDSEAPEGIPESAWVSIAKLCWNSTKVAAEMVGHETFDKMLGIVYVKHFPTHRKLLQFVSNGSYHIHDRYQTLSNMYLETWVRNIRGELRTLGEEIGQDLDLRLRNSNRTRWEKVDGWRGKKPTNTHGRRLTSTQQDKIKTLFGKGLLKTPKVESLDTLYNPEGKEICDMMMMDNHIIIAKTASALADTEFKISQYFSPNFTVDGRWHTYHWTNYTNHQNYWPIPAVVVHKKKGGYEAAVQHFQHLGYTVIEADEPEVRVKAAPAVSADGQPVAPARKGKPTFPVLAPRSNDWVCYGAPEIEKPKAYFNITVTAIHDYGWRGNKPGQGILQVIQKYWPETAVIHNKQRVSVVERAGARHVRHLIDEKVDRLLKNKERVQKMVLHDYVHNNSSLPREILEIPEMQKMFGIPYLRTKEKEAFQRDMYFLKTVKDEDWRELLPETRNKVKAALDPASYDNDLFSVAARMCKNSNIFNERELRGLVLGKKPGQAKVLMQKLARLLRTL